MEAVGINKWESLDTESFWKGMTEKDHVIHLYDHEESLLDSLAGFATACFRSDFAVVVMASEVLLHRLETKLRLEGYDIFGQSISGKYQALNARDVLSQFMFEGIPDRGLFSYMLSSFSLRSRRLGKRIKVFGELAGILHADGNHRGATLVEDLWAEYRATAPFCFFRACRLSDLPGPPNFEDLASRYSVVIGDQTTFEKVSFQRLS